MFWLLEVLFRKVSCVKNTNGSMDSQCCIAPLSSKEEQQSPASCINITQIKEKHMVFFYSTLKISLADSWLPI